MSMGEYTSGIKVLASEYGTVPILHAVIAYQDSKCQDSSGVRGKHIPAVHEQGVMEKMLS